jgi:nucleotide-binding universal stress UspA family protein
MEIRVILASLDIDVDARRTLACAVDLATRLDARIIGMAAAAPPAAAAGFASALAVTAGYAGARMEIETGLANLKNEFHTNVPQSLRLEWHGLLESPTAALLDACQQADLIITTTRGSGASSLRTVDVGAVVVAAGRPVLAVGAEASGPEFKTIVVGWKQAREARRAVADAVPLLRLADEVMVTTISEGNETEERASLEKLVTWLDRHGIKARSEVVFASVEGAGASLENVARIIGADLIVAGAYGQSRVRERLLGGMTKELLEVETVNRFFSN